MKVTDFYKLKQPDRADGVRISDINENTAAVDAELHRLSGALVPLRAELTAAQTVAADHTARIKALEDALFNELTGNPWSIRFENLTGLAITGIWNQTSRKIEC